MARKKENKGEKKRRKKQNAAAEGGVGCGVVMVETRQPLIKKTMTSEDGRSFRTLGGMERLRHIKTSSPVALGSSSRRSEQRLHTFRI